MTIVSVGDVINGHTISSIQPSRTSTARATWSMAPASPPTATAASTTGTAPTTKSPRERTDADQMTSELISVNDANQVGYITGNQNNPDETDGAAEGPEDGAFIWTKVGGPVKAIAVGDVVLGSTVTSLYAQHPSFSEAPVLLGRLPRHGLHGRRRRSRVRLHGGRSVRRLQLERRGKALRLVRRRLPDDHALAADPAGRLAEHPLQPTDHGHGRNRALHVHADGGDPAGGRHAFTPRACSPGRRRSPAPSPSRSRPPTARPARAARRTRWSSARPPR